MTVFQPIAASKWTDHRRADYDLTQGPSAPVLRNQAAMRSGAGVCTFHPPYKQKTTLEFRVEFEPRLRVGERVTIAFDLDVFQHKPATLERLRARPTPSVPPPGEAEFSSYDVTYPTASLVKEIVIPQRLCAGRFGLQAI